VEYFIEYKEVSNKWVLDTQLEPMNKDVPLPKKPEDIPEKGVKAYMSKLVNGKWKQKQVTIRKVECKFSATVNKPITMIH
jgi:hypothetical protein